MREYSVAQTCTHTVARRSPLVNYPLKGMQVPTLHELCEATAAGDVMQPRPRVRLLDGGFCGS
jgi:hypothetical protein